MKTFKKIVYWSLIILALIQFIPVDRTLKPINQKENFVVVFNTPKNVEQILEKACYDCHSNETVYPKYAYVAPISWSIQHHINEGREHLNFSEWGKFNQDLKKNMLENSARSVKDYSMPFPGYISQHPEANLTKAERVLLVDYFEGILKSGKY
ncbi:heme-binding domain-containing protein [Kaistella montana]|uniref:Heme-binding domain-containing protein n=1 Tax=Kaistella montana TaxID=1849733 RepID=A0ABW5K9G2_9FLAO|nr:heme-binding domain-containing protein [Kaistella montana]MCQ4035651.1 heme-binding domain-containing protein [Kaistella montana]